MIRSDAKRLVKAQRQVEKLQLQDQGAGDSQIAIWEAQNKVRDVQARQVTRNVRSVSSAALFMDLALGAVAVLTMGFSFGNIHTFALAHHVADPIAWFLAPAVDLALVAAIVGDAFLSRRGLDAGPWATRLRWYTGVSTLVLNTWSSLFSGSAASILVHVIPPILLIALAEAAPPYRRKFAESLDSVVRDVAPVVDVAPVLLVSPEVEAPEPARSPADLAEEATPVEDESVYVKTAAEPAETPTDTAPEAVQEVPTVAAAEAPTPKPRRTPAPRRATGKVPAAAKKTRPKRTFDELLAEARTLTLDDEVVSAEKIRTRLHVGPPKARELRDRIEAERAQVAEAVAAEITDHRHGLHAVPVG